MYKCFWFVLLLFICFNFCCCCFPLGLLDHVTVLIGVAVNGVAKAGVIYQPYYNYDKQPGATLGRCIWGLVGLGKKSSHHPEDIAIVCWHFASCRHTQLYKFVIFVWNLEEILTWLRNNKFSMKIRSFLLKIKRVSLWINGGFFIEQSLVFISNFTCIHKVN